MFATAVLLLATVALFVYTLWQAWLFEQDAAEEDSPHG